MSLRVVDLRPATSEEWDHIWKRCDYATYFHSREWAELWQKYTQGKMKPNAKFIVFSDGKSALLPFSTQRIIKGFAKKTISSPAGTYGGWLSLDKLLESHSRLLYEYITTHYKGLMWRLNPYNVNEASLNIDDVKHG